MPQISRYQRLKNAKLTIIKFFDNNDKKFFLAEELAEILADNIDNWLLARITRLVDFINFLKESNIIKETIKIELPSSSVTYRYLTGPILTYEIGSTLYKNSYYSHYTALYLHDLTNNIPKNIYLNKEQTKKYQDSDTTLTQANINRAFNRPMRKTNQIAKFKDVKIYMLNGKNTSNLGVIETKINGKKVLISDIERTLIDIVVRPEYAGGVNEIIEAYRLAKDHCSINYLLSLLKKLDYTYPYHQAIGFYLERAGYKESLLKKVEKIPQEFDFYLQYKMVDKDYSKRWKLFFPKGI